MKNHKNKPMMLIAAWLFVCVPTVLHAESGDDKKDDTRYLKGAVPEVDGKVVFSEELKLPGKTAKQVYDATLEWMSTRLAKNKNDESRVVFTNKEEGSIAGIGEEWIVFSSTALSLDRTLVNYQLTATCREGSCLLRIEKIRFTYREKEKYKAEEWITDRYALNKAGTKLVRGLAKWRRKTVDFADSMLSDAATALGVSVSGTTQPVVSAPTDRTPTYEEFDPNQIPNEAFALIGKGTLVVNVKVGHFNETSMVAEAGGALGYLSGKPTAYFTLKPTQSHDLVEKAEEYTLFVYEPGNTTDAKVIISCKKVPGQVAVQPDGSRTYTGEIIKFRMRSN